MSFSASVLVAGCQLEHLDVWLRAREDEDAETKGLALHDQGYDGDAGDLEALA